VQDISPQDVNQAADSSDAAPVTANEGAAPAGVTAASVDDGGAQSVPVKPGLEFKEVPYHRLAATAERARKFEQELARERAEKVEIAKKVADYEAKLARANEEPPAWVKSLLPQPKEPTFDDPLEERAYKLEKALEERDRKIAEIEKGLAEQRDGFTSYQQKLEAQQQQAKIEAQINADIDSLTKSAPELAPHLPDILNLVVESGGAISVQRAALIWRHENLVSSTPARSAVTAPTAPPMASAAVSAPRKPGPGPVASTPGNLQPARPRPRDLDEATAQLMADIKAGKMRAI